MADAKVRKNDERMSIFIVGETPVVCRFEIKLADSPQHLAQGSDKIAAFLKEIEIYVYHGEICCIAVAYIVVYFARHLREFSLGVLATSPEFVDRLRTVVIHT